MLSWPTGTENEEGLFILRLRLESHLPLCKGQRHSDWTESESEARKGFREADPYNAMRKQ